AQRKQHLGDPTHADPAYTDKMYPLYLGKHVLCFCSLSRIPPVLICSACVSKPFGNGRKREPYPLKFNFRAQARASLSQVLLPSFEESTKRTSTFPNFSPCLRVSVSPWCVFELMPWSCQQTQRPRPDAPDSAL